MKKDHTEQPIELYFEIQLYCENAFGARQV